jgi:hypothetical protein
VADAPIKGPGADAKPAKAAKPKPMGVIAKRQAVVDRIQQAHMAPAIAIEQTVAMAAAKLQITHERMMANLLDIAEHPYVEPAARVAATKQLCEIIGTKRQATENHLHLHQHLEQVPDERLEDRIARLIGQPA